MIIRMCFGLFALLLATAAVSEPAPAAAPVPRFSRMEVPGGGCALYAPKDFAFAPPSKSEDGSDVWQGEVSVGAWSFGAIVVKFPAPMEASGDELETLLISYLDFLKTQASITKSTGVGRGHTQADQPAARGVIDYWEAESGEDWAVKGWVDNSRLAVLFIHGHGEYPYLSAQQIYLDGFRFK